MTDEKKTFRINLVDILLTILIAGVIAVGAIMIANAFGVDASADKETVTVEYTLQFKDIMPELVGKVSPGDKIVDAQKRHYLGTVTEVYDYAYTEDVYDEDTQSMVLATHPVNRTYEITIREVGYLAEDGMYYLKDSAKQIAVGTGLSIHAPFFCGTGYVSAIRIEA